MPTVLLLSSVDTRKKEIIFLKGLIEDQGCKVIIMDLSMAAYKEGVADHTCIEVARKAGVEFKDIAASKDTNKNMEIMVKGATVIAKDLFQKGVIDTIAGFGGVSNATTISLIMKELL